MSELLEMCGQCCNVCGNVGGQCCNGCNEGTQNWTLLDWIACHYCINSCSRNGFWCCDPCNDCCNRCCGDSEEEKKRKEMRAKYGPPVTQYPKEIMMERTPRLSF